MVRTAIRPDDAVRFKDMDGTLLWQTSDAAGIYLSALDDKMPAVKTITVNVPARDGALDLTESVAGRPLYGNRRIDMTISITASDHPAAVQAVRAMRRAIHGVMCRVETPDNILPGNPPVQGWYVGRVSLGAVTYPGEAAVVKLTVDADPWVYYGTATTTLEAGSSTTHTWGIIPSWHRDRINDALISIRQVDGGWNKTTNYNSAGYVPATVALVMAQSPNLLAYGEQCEWHLWSIDSTAPNARWSDGLTGDATWVRSADEYDRAIGPIDAADMSTDHAYRWMLTSTAGTDGVERGIIATNLHDVFRIRVSGSIVDDAPGTVLGLGPAVSVLAQGAYLPNGIREHQGLFWGPSITDVQYYTVWDSDSASGTFDEVIEIDLAEVLDSVIHSGYVIFGVEARWVSADISRISVELVDPDEAATITEDYEPANTITRFATPAPLYSASSNYNTVEIAPYGAQMTAPLAVPAGSDTASVVTPPTVYPMQLPQVENATHLRAYGITNYGWLQLATSAEFWEWDDVTLDVGDMPGQVTLDTADPVVFDVDGSRWTMTGSGTMPATIDGEVELGFMVMGDTDATLTYEKGTV